MELQVGVKAFLKNKEGNYLLLKRSPEKYPDVTHLWDIPGGRIDPGSSLIDNLKREIKEETDLELTHEPKLIAAQDILRPPARHVVRLTYVGDVEGKPKLDMQEHSEFRWVTLEELKSLDGLALFENLEFVIASDHRKRGNLNSNRGIASQPRSRSARRAAHASQ